MTETYSKPGISPRNFRILNYLFVIVDDPDQIQEVLSSSKYVDKPEPYSGIVPKDGLISLNGATWKTHRRLLEPSLNSSVLKSFTPIINENARICVKLLENFIGKGEFDILQPMAALTIDNILTTSLGIVENIQKIVNETGSHEILNYINQ